jgi:hypothetical protein
MPLVGASLSFAGRAERLTGTTSRPNRSVIRPACKAQRVRPSADAGEEVALGVSTQVVWLDINDASLVNNPSSNLSTSNEPP